MNLKDVGWHRCGTHVTYRRNDYQYSKPRRSSVLHYYTLKFSVQFPCSDDTAYLAHCYPFSYTDLQQYLSGLESNAQARRRCRRRLLCKTIAGNRCELLTITGGNDVRDSAHRDGDPASSIYASSGVTVGNAVGEAPSEVGNEGGGWSTQRDTMGGLSAEDGAAAAAEGKAGMEEEEHLRANAQDHSREDSRQEVQEASGRARRADCAGIQGDEEKKKTSSKKPCIVLSARWVIGPPPLLLGFYYLTSTTSPLMSLASPGCALLRTHLPVCFPSSVVFLPLSSPPSSPPSVNDWPEQGTSWGDKRVLDDEGLHRFPR